MASSVDMWCRPGRSGRRPSPSRAMVVRRAPGRRSGRARWWRAKARRRFWRFRAPANFGIEQFGPVIKVALAQTFERRVITTAGSAAAGDGMAAAGHLCAAGRAKCCPPRPPTISGIPAYSDWGRPTNQRSRSSGRPQTQSRPRLSRSMACLGRRQPPRPAASGHQLTGVRPPTNLSAPQMR